MKGSVLTKVKVYILSIPKSFYLNVKALGWSKGIHFPIFVHYKTKLGIITRDSITIDSRIECGMIKLGMTSGSFSKGEFLSSRLDIINGGKVVFAGKCVIERGFTVVVEENGYLYIGDNFYGNYELLLRCSNRITINSDALLGWNVSINDDDGHFLLINNIRKDNSGKINIGKHVWIASNVTILKNSMIGDNSVVATGSVISKPFFENNVLIGGIPGCVKRKNIEWEK